MTKLIPDISLNSCAVGFKFQERFLAQANGGSIHKHGVYFVRDVLERLSSLLIFFLCVAIYLLLKITSADPHLSEKKICSYGRDQSLTNEALRIEYEFDYCCF